MSEPDSNIPFDDELLSAYLDDELTPDERALVEQRLATDPAARRQLDQLQAVSRAVRDLPREAVGEDLREAILQRAQRASAKAGEAGGARRAGQAADAATDWPTPKLSVGRTARGWVWAGLAAAAALVIMVLQPGEERQADVPGSVAMRTERERVPELRSREDVSGAEADRATAATGRIGGGGGFGGAGDSTTSPATAPTTVGAPLASSSESASESETLRRSSADFEDNLALSAPTGGVAAKSTDDGEAAVEFDAVAAEPLAEADADEDQLLVVHVQVTPVALKSKSFDAVLARNGIALEESPATDNRSARIAEEEASQEGALLGKEQGSEPATQLDVVLVDAPAAQVESCLAELDKDTTNYLAVDIEDEPARAKAPPDKRLPADQWKQYARGSVPLEQKAMVNRGVLDAPAEKAAGTLGADYYRGRAQQELSALRQNIKSDNQQARAARVQMEPQSGPALGFRLRDEKSSLSGEAPAAPAMANAKTEQAEVLSRKLAQSGDNVQVLFILGCESEPTSSPPADKRLP